jgi:hypothetical protein
MCEFLIILHIVSLCVGLCLSLYVVTLRTSQNLTKEKNYLCYMEGTMGYIWPQAEININKKYIERHKN